MEEPVLIYDRLLELPLFQGHSREDLTRILTHIKVDFRTFRPKQQIVTQDSPCTGLIFLLEGDMVMARESYNHSLCFEEYFHAPNVFGIDALFGLTQNFNYSLTAAKPPADLSPALSIQDPPMHAGKDDYKVRTLWLSKQNIITHLFSYEVFRFNLINLLTTRIQRQNRLLWAAQENDITKKFVRLCKCNFYYLGGRKQISGGMVQVAEMINDSRSRVSRMLNDLERRGLITLNRSKIIIPRLERLIREA